MRQHRPVGISTRGEDRYIECRVFHAVQNRSERRAGGSEEADADVLARKLVALRIFPGRTPMDLSIRDVHGACLVVSQFTLAGSTRKGNRPSFDRAEDPALAQKLYERIAERIRRHVAGSPFRVLGGEELLTVTISIGVAASLAEDTQAKLINRADQAMYEAKEAGRNRVIAKVA